MIFDTHCHLDYFSDAELSAIIPQMINNKMHCTSISTKLNGTEKIYNIVKDHDTFFMSIGEHPDNYKQQKDPISKNDIVSFVKKYEKKVVGIGETGLDYIKIENKKLQIQAFENHIQAGLETDLPIIIHTREAEKDTIEIIDNYKNSKLKGIMHCFTGSKELMFKALDAGFFISFSGIVTFKNAKDVFDRMMECPNDRLICETDAPFLAPMPHRGERNKPYFVEHVIDFICQNKGISKQEIFENSCKIFHINV